MGRSQAAPRGHRAVVLALAACMHACLHASPAAGFAPAPPLALQLESCAGRQVARTRAPRLASVSMQLPESQLLLATAVSGGDAMRYFFSGGICCCISHGMTVPIDVVKTRMQTGPLATRLRLLAVAPPRTGPDALFCSHRNRGARVPGDAAWCVAAALIGLDDGRLRVQTLRLCSCR